MAVLLPVPVVPISLKCLVSSSGGMGILAKVSVLRRGRWRRGASSIRVPRRCLKVGRRPASARPPAKPKKANVARLAAMSVRALRCVKVWRVVLTAAEAGMPSAVSARVRGIRSRNRLTGAWPAARPARVKMAVTVAARRRLARPLERR